MEALTIIVSVLVSAMLVKSIIGKNREEKRFYSLDWNQSKDVFNAKTEGKWEVCKKYLTLVYMVCVYVIKITFVVLVVIGLVSKAISWLK